MRKMKVSQIIKAYGIKSVFFKYMLSFLAIIFLIFVPFYIIIYQYYYYTQTQEIAKQSSISTLQSKTIFDYLTSEFHKNYNMAAGSDAVLQFLDTSYEDSKLAMRTANTRTFIETLLNSSDLVEESYIYSFGNKISVSSNEERLIGLENPYDWVKTYLATKLPFVMFPRKENSDQFNYLYICSEIYSDGALKGLFCSKINYAKFSDIVQSSFVERPDQIFIVSNIGLILYSDDKNLINKPMFAKDDTYAAFDSAKSESGNFIVYGDYIIAVAKSENSELMIMSYIHKEKIDENFKFFNILAIGESGVIFLASILLALYISYRHYLSVAEVVTVLNDPSKLDQKSHLLSEFFYIANSISDISQQNQTISNTLTENMYLLKKAQIAALQAQINPHFLFNTLQLINLSIIAEVKSDNASTLLVSQLSSLVRTAYDTDQYIITVEEEIDVVKTYLSIQQFRFESHLQVFIDVDESCLTLSTIKLLLQPLVENSIVHGFKGKDGDWNIHIRCFQESNYLIYEIWDNGIGIDYDSIEKLNNMLEQNKTDNSDRVGIANVNQRLKLVFGGKCSMTIYPRSEGKSGTKITIRHMINEFL